MRRLVRWMQDLIRKLRRRQVIQVAGVYAGTAFVILQLGEILVEPFGLPGWTLRMVTFLLVFGFPLALGLAWVYNLTEEDLVRDVGEEETGEEASGEIGPEGKPLTSNWVLVGLLVLIAGLLLLYPLLYPRVFSAEEGAGEPPSPPGPAQVEERSIAVLPFDPLSPDQKSKTFGRGVRWLMEGVVQKEGDQIQVRAQLIDPRTDGHVWANDYQRRLTAQNLFAIQGDITQKIADALKAQLTTGEQNRIAGAPTGDLTAYRLSAEGRRALSEQELGNALTQFSAALSRDSSFALAWAGMADALGDGALAPGRYRPVSIQLPDATQMEAARRALTLDPDLAEAHSALGHAYLETRNAPAALREARRAVELKPSYADARQLLGTLLQVIGCFEDALQHFQVAEKLNPHHLIARHRRFDALMWAGKYKEALIEVRQQQEMSNYVPGIWAEVRALRGLERYEEAVGLARKRLRKTEEPWERLVLHSHLVEAEAQSGDTTQARRHLRAMQQVPLSPEQRRTTSWIFMSVQANLGHFDATFQEVRLEDWEDTVAHIALRGVNHPIRQDPVGTS